MQSMTQRKEKEMDFDEERSRVGSTMSKVSDRRSMGGKNRSCKNRSDCCMAGLEEERSKSSAKEDEEVKVDNTGLGAEATRGVVEGANMGNKQ